MLEQEWTGNLEPDALEYVISQQWVVETRITPLPYLETILGNIVDRMSDHIHRSPKLRLRGTTTEDVGSRRIGYFRKNYEISLSRSFVEVLQDAAEFYGVRIAIVSTEGKVLQPVELSDDNCARAFAEKIVQHFARGKQWWISRFDLIRGRRVQHEMSIPEAQRRAGIIYFLFQQMIMFTLAHEVGHIVLGHCDTTRPEDLHGRFEREYEADALAVGLTVKFAIDNGKSPEQRMFGLVGTITAIALLFGIHEAIHIAAGQLGHSWERTYPPPIQRYATFKNDCIASKEIPAEAFVQRISHLGPPDAFAAWFPEMAGQINWRKIQEELKDDPKRSTREFYRALYTELLGHARRESGLDEKVPG